MYTLQAQYPETMDQNSTDRILYNLARKHKGRDTGRGFGFGWRDIDFEFPTANNRNAFVAEVAEKHTRVLVTW